ncbi:unnamed protein product (macronuclear) [Paramecium tetraurelia]|uniref:FHA domain-containing protein n=1 Tax=Paramecium tetraurelia TaxID=5888 RepID=A0E6A4_PARTE|nr:uncharacterized protein GSPATT00003686001 [Paramecium tetraurelia]CAK90821.1 unnamed protein product [Paramecium tetraurelia]|eukprot:XP_001458218.1 hypothetical protein (macronuclear) [Paramecium tetraurelia strain d4-2]
MDNDGIVNQVDNAKVDLFPIPPQIPTNQIINQKIKINLDPKLDKYHQKRTTTINNTELNELEPYIIVSVRSNKPTTLEPSTQYFINQDGLIGSPKTADSEDIIIGRSHVMDVNPLDIMLEKQKNISKIHCKLVCKDYFRKDPILKLIYTLALDSIRTQSNFPLPPRARFIISQFLDKPRHVYIQDLGSLGGTSLLINNKTPYIMKQDQIFCYGTDSNFKVNFCQSFNEEGKEIDDHFFWLLKKLNLLNNPKNEIHFNDPELHKKFWNIYQQQGDIEDSQSTTSEQKDIYDKLKEYQVSFITIEFKSEDIKKNIQNIFLHLENQDSNDITIGRSTVNDFVIKINTVSRQQCRFQYLKNLKAWGIFDGTKDSSSINGTKVQLQTVQQKQNRQESDLIEVKDDAEINVPSIILKINMVKGRQFQINNNNDMKK